MDKEAERQWVRTAPKDPQALIRLYDHYFPRLWAYVSYRISAQQDVEDIVADVFLKVVRDIGQFKWHHDHSFSGWIFKIASNKVADFHRQNSSENRLRETLMHMEKKVLLTEQTFIQQETFTQVKALISQLSPRRQEIITLKFFGQLRNQEIAAILQLDERTVAAHLCRGLQDLYRRFGETASIED